MNLKILLPFQIFAEKTGVARVVAQTREGSFGLLPHRLDCVAALAPGILTYETEADGEVFVAVDEGVLIKTGADVLVSVRRALGGADLGQLRAGVERVLEAHEFAFMAGKLLGGEKGLGEKALQPAGADDHVAVFRRKLLEAEHGDDVLEIGVLGQRAPDLLR